MSDLSESHTFGEGSSGLATAALAKRGVVAASIGTGSDASESDDDGLHTPAKKRAAGADRACRALVLARPEPVDDGSASSGCERQSTRAPPRCTPRKTDAKGDYSLSEDDKDEHEEYPKFIGSGLAKFYDVRTGFVKFFRKRIAASGIASDNIFKKPDAAWAKVKDIEGAKECEYEEKRAAFQSASAAVKSLPSKICAWENKDNICWLRLDVKGKLEDAVCAHEDWLEAIEAMNKLKYERMKVRNRVNRAIKVSHDKPKSRSWTLGCTTCSPSFWHTT